MLIDSHCHLDHFKPDEMGALLDRAETAGLRGIVTIGTRLSAAPLTRTLTAHTRTGLQVWCTVGTHPDHVDDEVMPEPAALAELASAPEVVGIGETGLDYFHGQPHVRSLQQASFRAHLRAARLADVPLVIHARDADEDVAAILTEEHTDGGPFRFLLHCFSSGRSLAQTAVALGGYVSFSGILTFPKSNELRAIAAELPEERLLVETDAPYLAPVPQRGRRNEPSFVAHTAAALAKARGLSDEALATITTRNFHRLFGKAR
jgi:TatD DNase family protein